MSKWQDAGFPDNLHLAPKLQIATALSEAVYERTGIGHSQAPFDGHIYTTLHYILPHCYLVDDSGTHWEVVARHHGGNFEDCVQFICENILHVEYVPINRFDYRHDVRRVLMYYHIINHLTAPNMLQIPIQSFMHSEESSYLSGLYWGGTRPGQANYCPSNSAFKDEYRIIQKLALRVRDYRNFAIDYARPENFRFDVHFKMYTTTQYDYEYSQFNSGWVEGEVRNFTVQNILNPPPDDDYDEPWGTAPLGEHHVFLEGIFAPEFSTKSVAMELIVPELQSEEIVFDNGYIVQKAKLFFKTDATPYLEYYDPPEET